MKYILTLVLLSAGIAGAEELRSAEADEAARPGAEQAAAFADSLFERGDYYRAIGEYERALFLAPAAPEASAWELQIGAAYLKGEQYGEAAKAYERVARRQDGVVKARALLGGARASLAGGQYESAAARAKEAAAAFGEGSDDARAAHYVEGWALLHSQRDEEAAAAFRLARGESAKDAVGAGSQKLLDVLPQLNALPSKSPVLAGILGLIPGAGHLYLGDPGTALSALIWNGVFIWAIVEQVREEQWSLVVVLSMFEAMWYGGSIVGAVGGAHRYNRDARVNAMEDLERISPKDLSGGIGTKVSHSDAPHAPTFAITLPF